MDFGVIPYDELTEKDFAFTQKDQVYLPGNRYSDPRLYIGLSKWNDKAWEGKLYPPRTKNNAMLPAYAKQFNTVEFNASHYHIPSIEQVAKWIALTGKEDFHFCPKFSKLITHQGAIKVESKQKISSLFIDTIREFDSQLGPAFLQVSNQYLPKNKEELFQYLDWLPKDLLVFTELRHPDWFEEKMVAELTGTLHNLNKGWVMTDTPGRRDVLHRVLTIPHAFIRFVCDGNHALDLYRIQQWKEELQYWYNQGLQSCHFFLHIHDDSMAIDFAKYVQQEFASLLKP